jgi:L-threonylcarbamoyladenylate synthase
MQTILTSDVDLAASIIRGGGVVAFPTETVYGLGANVFDPGAVERIFEAKQRPADNPLIAHIADLVQIKELAHHLSANAQKLIDAFFPGPLTVVLAKSDGVPLIATAGLDTIGVRMPKFDLAHRFLADCAVPVVAPSANLSGRPSPTTWEAVAEDLDGRIDCILKGEATEIGLESTVVDCTGDIPLLLRKGSVSLVELQRVVPETRSVDAAGAETVRSPGLRHKHYSPRAKVVLIDPRSDISDLRSAAGFIGLHERNGRFECTLVCRSENEYAHSLFEFFRNCDRKAIDTIYCEMVDESGIGAALMDRLRRAAE